MVRLAADQKLRLPKATWARCMSKEKAYQRTTLKL